MAQLFVHTSVLLGAVDHLEVIKGSRSKPGGEGESCEDLECPRAWWPQAGARPQGEVLTCALLF